MNTAISACELQWLSEGEPSQRLAYALGGINMQDIWPVVPVLKSAGSAAAIFATSPPMIPNHCSPSSAIAGVDPMSLNSRKNVQVGFTEIDADEWQHMYE